MGDQSVFIGPDKQVPPKVDLMSRSRRVESPEPMVGVRVPFRTNVGTSETAGTWNKAR